MKTTLSFLLLIFSVCLSFGNSPKLTSYINPFIGTAGGAHCYPGATVPFGMVQLSPDMGNSSSEDFFNYKSGKQYDYNLSEIQGFSHLHLSGTAHDPAGDISVMPMYGEKPSAKLIKSKFSHSQEWASPGYYAVDLEQFRIKAELTTTTRCGFHRYTFPESNEAIIRFDLAYHNGGKPLECEFRKLNDSTFIGSRFSTGYADDKRVFFAVRTSKPIRDLVLFADSTRVKSKEQVRAVGVKACLIFSTREREQILMKVAISFANTEGAIAGLNEIRDWSFDRVQKEASDAWEKELEKIQVQSDNNKFLQIFYTAVYHCYIAPTRFDDYNHAYRGPDGKNHQGNTIFTQYGLWDTYRALHPLFTISQTERVSQIMQSFLAFYEQYGLLPVWEMAFCETHCMTGYHAVPVLADAILKGFTGFDYEKAYEAMKASANQDIRNSKDYRTFHFVPFETSTANVTKTTEYAFDDWCIAQVARKLGKTDDYKLFMQRSSYWKNLFDPQSGFARPKYSNGNWVPGFDPLNDRTNGKESYTEGNSWHYTFMVPQDPYGLIKAFGSPERFSNKLDSFFTTAYPTDNYLGGMGGLIGQYAHGNQPSHHIPYFYHFVGKPYKTAETVQQIMHSFYSDKPDGIINNEDTGSMSSWYVWNAMGLYPFNPAGGEYLIISPLLQQSTINLANGKKFIIRAENLSSKNIYVQEATLNGKPYTKSYITHNDLMNGSQLILKMGSQPSKTWGILEKDLPGKH